MSDDQKLFQIKPKQRVPADSAARLRLLADQIESGVCTGVVWSCIVDGAFECHSGSSLIDSMVLSSLLQDWCVRKFRE